MRRGRVTGAGQEKMSVKEFQVFLENLQKLWESWNLRVSVLFSLLFQIILIFFASARKRSGNMLLHAVIWSSYLLADWVAAYAVGLISSSQSEKCEKAAVDDALAAFWAPFLLLHLGGPDTITAFSLEDNELWQRHMLNVMAQVLAVGYVFVLALTDKLWLPTALVYFAGTLKYAERTRALYMGCLSNLKDSLKPKPDPGPNYAQLMEEYSSNQAANVPEEIHRAPEEFPSLTLEEGELEEKEMISRACKFYQIFRGLIVDHTFSFHERIVSRNFFLPIKAVDAFKFMEVELNFMYDALYTKMASAYNGTFWYIMRFLCSALLVAALVLFALHHKLGIHPIDRALTYGLLIGALVLDFVALVKLIYSDWTIASLSLLKVIPDALTSTRRIIPKRIRKRWSGCVYRFSIITYCLQEGNKLLDEIADFFALKELLDKFRYRKKWDLDDDLKEFIFDVLKEKAMKAEDTTVAKDIYSARGEWTLRNYKHEVPDFVEWSVSEDVEYDESVLMWHIATEICYYNDSKGDKKIRTRCKHLSDYLLYLLIMQPKLMLSVAGIAQIRFQDTYAEARKFFERTRSTLDEKSACEKLIKVETAVEPVEVKGDRSKSVLFNAVMLAKELKNKMDAEADSKETWEMISKVWLELLCYGASNCRGDAHAQQLRQGGELITFVWLLMAHFGLGQQFRIVAGHVRAKLIVEK